MLSRKSGKQLYHGHYKFRLADTQFFHLISMQNHCLVGYLLLMMPGSSYYWDHNRLLMHQ